MTRRTVAVKCYGFDWMTQLGLDEARAAALMASHRVDWALVQNTVDPLPTSGVEQHLPEHYDERRFRDALRQHGMRVFESTAVYFQPDAVAADPDLRPVADDGTPMVPFDWYLGVSPHSRAYLARRAELTAEVVDRFQPDGMFLSFIRFPGFWEGWTPRVPRSEIRDYGFAPGSLERFQADTGHVLPSGAVEAAAVLLHELRAEWTAWKCAVVLEAVAELTEAARRVKGDVEVMINGVAFPRGDRGSLATEVLGQDLGAISTVADHVETMVYHQILDRPIDPWIGDVIDDLRPQVRGTLLASIQTSPAYAQGLHAPMGRKPDLPPSEVAQVLGAVARSAADGVSVYHWTDVAADDLVADGQMARALRAYAEGEL